MRYSAFPQRVRFIAGISSVLLLAACGSDSEQQSSAAAEAADSATADVTFSGPENACVLLPAADVESVVGETVRDSLALNIPGQGPATASQCNYGTADNPAAVSVLLRRSLPGESTEVASQSVRETFSERGVDMEDVPGVGEVAFWGSNQLHVFVDQDWYMIISPVASGGLAQARALADVAMARL